MPRGKSKWSAKRTVVDGVTFHSKKEADRYVDLKLLQRCGDIRDLELQPRFHLSVNGFSVCDYIADFKYKDQAGNIVVEDVKGAKKGAPYQMYRIKAKLLFALTGIEVLET